MISKVKQENRGSVKIAEYIGLSTDDKTNLDGCVNGSTILYMDTNKIAAKQMKEAFMQALKEKETWKYEW